MKAIIPIAGQGTRLEPHTKRIQKCLLPVGGRPVLEHILDPLREIGVNKVTLIIGYLGDQVKEYVRGISDFNFSFIRQKERLGLAHAINLGLDNSEEPVLIILGDSIIEVDYTDFVNSNSNVIGVVEVSDPERFGIVEHKDGNITRLEEKPQVPASNLAIAGLYYIKKQSRLNAAVQYLIRNQIRTRGEYQLTDALQHMVSAGDEFTLKPIDNLLDCGVPQTLLATNRILFKRKGASRISGESQVIRSRISNCYISKGCLVESAALDNVIMLPDSQVRHIHLVDTIVGFEELIEGIDPRKK